ncbi:ATP-binding protein [Thiovibrio sp. JS02]
MRKRPTISVYLLGMNMILLCVLFPAFSYFILRETVQLRDIQLERNINMIRQGLVIRSASLVRSTAMSAREAVAGFDFTFLQNLVAEVVRDDPEILYCLIMDRSRTVVAHNDANQVGSRLAGKRDARAALLMEKAFPVQRPDGKIPVEYLWPEMEEAGNHSIMEAVFPVYSGETLWGMIRCGYSLAPLEKEIVSARTEWAAQMRQTTRYFGYILSFFLLAGLGGGILLSRSFVRATRALHAGVRQVAAGELDREIALQGMVCEEFSGLAFSFNSMTEKLRLMRQQLDGYAKSLEVKVAERTRELEVAQDIMVRQAHEAGMAEMAVGVLHNIGNAITPAQVGAATLCSHLAQSPLRFRLAESLAPLRDLLEGTRVLSEEEREHCLNIIRYLPAGVAEELDRIVGELRSIMGKHRHIENIIRLQMRYARLMDNPDLLDINRLVKDALKILADDIGKRHVTVVMRLGEVPPVRAEEAKLLQVLVNLIKNGYEAMDGCVGKARELAITTTVRDADGKRQVLFSVKDTGCGFSEEEKKRFSTFGYSTKERGSGFGLHSCANYMIANNGFIEAESEGPDKGARFSAVLPAAASPGQD